MKKLNKKTKLIVLIAIILVAVMLTIVITTNVINSNVGTEGYLATTANANSNLVAGYIKEGITIGGITGTLESLNTFDATATAEDIAWGETAYVKGEKITGTKIITIAHAKEAQKVFEENTVLIDDYGNRIKVPVGFKIAEDSARTGTIDVSNATNPITCKAGVYPYTFINENDSSGLCRQMYNSIEFESDLINSYAWDTAIVFIQKFSGDANYSKQIGKNTANDVQKCGTSILDIVDNESEKMI